MLPALQPSRPKAQAPPPRPGVPLQQKRTTHAPPRQQQLPTGPAQAPLNPGVRSQPRNQVEAMPPFGQMHPPVPPQLLYNSAIRHPVFFTEQLKKPPFPIPEIAGHGFNPVASGYIMETRRTDTSGIPKTKL